MEPEGSLPCSQDLFRYINSVNEIGASVPKFKRYLYSDHRSANVTQDTVHIHPPACFISKTIQRNWIKFGITSLP